MGLFPKIQSPCPYRANLAAIMDGDVCRLCKRQVTDLTAMSDVERVAFMDACTEDEVCVSYRIPVLAAFAVGATLAAASPAAADVTTEIVVTGGMVHPAKVEYLQPAEAVKLATSPAPELPEVYDAKTQPPLKLADPAPSSKAADASKSSK